VLQLIFVMPDTYPVTLRNLNYSPVAVGLALILLLAAWFFPVYGVGRWFRGKAHTLKDANLVRAHPQLQAQPWQGAFK
jgi:hypothetical protein